jgi:hypothetical protein
MELCPIPNCIWCQTYEEKAVRGSSKDPTRLEASHANYWPKQLSHKPPLSRNELPYYCHSNYTRKKPKETPMNAPRRKVQKRHDKSSASQFTDLGENVEAINACNEAGVKLMIGL